MTPSSITIRIEFNPEGTAGASSNVTLQGDIPTPISSGAFSATGITQTVDILPTPFDNSAHSLAVGHEQAPTPFSETAVHTGLTEAAPSPDMEPAELMEKKK